MLLVINIFQLILYLGGLALLGQGALYALAGARRHENLFYQILQLLTKPYLAGLRLLLPRRLTELQLGMVATGLVAVLYVVVTLWKIDYCLSAGLAVCRSTAMG